MTPLWRVFEKSKQSQVRMPQLLAGTMSSSVSPRHAPEPGTEQTGSQDDPIGL